MPRIQSLDLARGLTVLIMPSIHVVMLYSQPHVQQSILGTILAFIAEGPGAQLFMMIMGISFVFSSRITKQYVLQRAFYLLLAAYVLNFLKFIVPLLLGWMPDNLMQELQLPNDFLAIPFFLLLGDILHFAAISFPILFIVYRLRHYAYWSVAFAITIMLLSPFIWDVKTGFVFVDYPLQLLGGHPPNAFFPVFPWLVYPLTGLTVGYFLKQFGATDILKKAGWIGVSLMLISLTLPPTSKQKEWLPFYRTEPADTLFHSGFVLTWIAIFHWLNRKIPANPFFTLLIFCSKNITSIYIIQWVLICWGMAYTGYLTLGLLQTFCCMGAISIMTLLLAALLKRAYAKPKNL